jgi:hypothetical protein
MSQLQDLSQDSTDDTSNQIPSYLEMLYQVRVHFIRKYDSRFSQFQQNMPSRWRRVTYHLTSSAYYVGAFCVYGLIGSWYAIVPLCKSIVILPFWMGTFVPHKRTHYAFAVICAKMNGNVMRDLMTLSSMQFTSHVDLCLAWYAAKKAVRQE